MSERRPVVLVSGPLRSEHIQRWYQHWGDHFGNTQHGDVELIAVTAHPGGSPFPGKVHSARVTGTRLDFLFLIPLYLFCLLRYRPVVTNFHFVSSYGLLALLGRSGVPLLHTWGSDVNLAYQRAGFCKRWLLRKTLRKMYWINAPAEHLKQKLIHSGAWPGRVDVFQYGVDTNALEVLAESRGAGNGNSESTGNSRILKVVSNRNWDDLYRVADVVQGFVQWQQQTNAPPAELVLYGSGTKQQQRTIRELIDAVPAALKSRFKVKGKTRPEVMLREMAEADVFVSIPVRDGTPLSLLEAMSLGLFPVVSDLDANREWLDDHCASWVTDQPGTVAEGCATAMASAAAVVLGDSQATDSFRGWQQRNREKVHTNADFATNTQRYYLLIDELLEQLPHRVRSLAKPEPPLISVYIPTHNRPKQLKKAIDSVLQQTWKNLEVLVSDDGSDSRTKELVTMLAAKDSRVRYLRTEHSLGAPAARNRAIAEARGEYITGLDDDDWFAEYHLEELHEKFTNENYRYSFVSPRYLRVTKNRSKREVERGGCVTLTQLLHYNRAGNQVFTRTRWLQAIGGFDESMPALQDYDTWVRLAETFGPGVKLRHTTYFHLSEPQADRITGQNNKRIKGWQRFQTKHAEKMDRKQLKSQELLRLRIYGERLTFTRLLRLINRYNWKSALAYYLRCLR